MTILIKGMEMPMSGDVLDILVFPNGEVQKRCSVNAFHLVQEASAIPVPTPHGRLIDADALKVERPITDGSITVGVSYAITRKEIDEAPTVIEEEEKDE